MPQLAVALEKQSDDKRVGRVRLGNSSQSTVVEKSRQTFQKADGASGLDTPHYPQREAGSVSKTSHLNDWTVKI
jgi:hypothetical protein